VKGPDIKEHAVYDLIYKKCPKKVNPKRQKIKGWVRRWEVVINGCEVSF
jgi:hypothetical protein